MNTLAIASFGTSLEIGLSTPSGFYMSHRIIGLKHNQILLGLIDTILGDADISMKEIELVVCTQGPGSFTAIRILLSTAKGLASGSGAALVSVPTFDVIGDLFSWPPDTVVPVVDGKKNKFYNAFYMHGKKIESESDIPRHELMDRISRHAPVILIGEAAQHFKEESSRDPENLKIVSRGFSLVRNLIEMGRKRFEKLGSCDKMTAPIYIRKSDAELRNVSNK